MAGWRGYGPRLLRAWIVAGVMGLGLPVAAQEATAQDAAAPLLTLDQERLFLESDFGKATIERERVATAALEQENRTIETELIAEEQALTEARAAMTPEEFAAKAEAFDAKVQQIRTAQDAKARRLTEGREQDRKAFLEIAVPVLGKLLGDKKATAILDKNLVILSLSAIDITDEAIARVNAALAEQPVPKP